MNMSYVSAEESLRRSHAHQGHLGGSPWVQGVPHQGQSDLCNEDVGIKGWSMGNAPWG
jgi:hypothetical protein